MRMCVWGGGGVCVHLSIFVGRPPAAFLCPRFTYKACECASVYVCEWLSTCPPITLGPPPTASLHLAWSTGSVCLCVKMSAGSESVRALDVSVMSKALVVVNWQEPCMQAKGT
jgi:hypothetical protein